MKWQYWVTTVTMTQRPALANTINSAGANGWELVSVVTEQLDAAGQVLTLFFKKQA